MKIVLAPDSFKESLTAQEACRAMERAVRKVLPSAKIVSIPMADGGEGTLSALAGGRGRILTCRARDPLGRPVQARFGFLSGERTAVVEMAEASGLERLPPKRRNPLITSSYGTGELIRAALDRGAREIILTLGGVATNDAGAGMAEALGFRFLDGRGKPVPRGAGGLKYLERIDASRTDPRLKKVHIQAACDVTNPLCGPRGSAAVYGPQKGATPAMIPKIDHNLRRFAAIVRRDLRRNILRIPGGGAAGGAGAGAAAFLNAILKPGIELVMDAVHFRERIRGADLILTGEGRIDVQTAYGKTLAGVAREARRRRIPVLAFCGEVGPGTGSLHRLGITSTFAISRGPANAADSMERAGPLLSQSCEEALRTFAAARGWSPTGKPVVPILPFGSLRSFRTTPRPVGRNASASLSMVSQSNHPERGPRPRPWPKSRG